MFISELSFVDNMRKLLLLGSGASSGRFCSISCSVFFVLVSLLFAAFLLFFKVEIFLLTVLAASDLFPSVNWLSWSLISVSCRSLSAFTGSSLADLTLSLTFVAILDLSAIKFSPKIPLNYPNYQSNLAKIRLPKDHLFPTILEQST